MRHFFPLPGESGWTALPPRAGAPSPLVLGVPMNPEESRTPEVRLRAAVESSPSGLLMVDQEGRIVLVNREVERLFGYPREELLGQSVDLLVPEVLRAGHAHFRSHFLSEPRVRAMGAGRDLYGRRKDGTHVPVEIGLTPVATEDGMFILSSIVDISARKREEEERAELELQLRHVQKMDAVGTLAGGIAHDFNNILGAILGFAELLRGSVTGEQAHRDLDELLAFTQRGKSLVEKIQAFGRRGEGERRPFAIEGPMSEVESFLRSSLPPAVEIFTDIHPETPRVLADPSAMHQVLMNLGMNAGQAMPDGGRLGIQIEPLYVTDSRARAHPRLREGPHLLVSVRDTGTGIDPEIQARVFEPFFTTRAPGKGSGLGLAIVHRIISEHGGAVELESRLGEGTTVRLILPAVQSGDPVVEVQKDRLQLGGGERILYVDDEPGLRTLGRRRLQQLGYDPVIAADGVEALQIFRADPEAFQLVISDYLMPRMTGLEFASALSVIRPDIPIILLTGFVDDLPEAEIRAGGVTEILRKPVTGVELATALRKVLSRGVRPA